MDTPSKLKAGGQILSELRAFYPSEWDMNQAMMEEKRQRGGGLLQAAQRLLESRKPDHADPS